MERTRVCRVCKKSRRLGKDNLCSRCRGHHQTPNLLKGRTLYPFDEAKDQALRRIYLLAAEQKGAGKKILSRELTKLSLSWGYPKDALSRQAALLGISLWRATRWSHEEIAIIERFAGEKSLQGILRELRKHGFRRGYAALGAKILQIGRSAKITEGYSTGDLQQLLGVVSTTIARWERAGWMVRNPDTKRFSDQAVARFLKKHPNEWYFKRVDEAWAKALLFPAFSLADTSETRASRPMPVFTISIDRPESANSGSLVVGD